MLYPLPHSKCEKEVLSAEQQLRRVVKRKLTQWCQYKQGTWTTNTNYRISNKVNDKGIVNGNAVSKKTINTKRNKLEEKNYEVPIKGICNTINLIDCYLEFL